MPTYFILILEMPDAAALAQFLLTIGSLGNVRTTTMKAYPEAEYRKIMAELG